MLFKQGSKKYFDSLKRDISKTNINLFYQYDFAKNLLINISHVSLAEFKGQKNHEYSRIDGEKYLRSRATDD